MITKPQFFSLLLALLFCLALGTHAFANPAGDTDHDGDVDFDDISTQINYYGLSSGATPAQGDTDGDGDVDADDAFTLISNEGTGAFATTQGTSTPDSKMTIQYDFNTGNMTILDPLSPVQLKSARVRSTSGLLIPGVANWIGQDYTTLSNTATNQSFATSTGVGDTFLVTAPYNIGNIYPAFRTSAQLLADLTIDYGVQGVAGLPLGDLVVINQPTGGPPNDTVITPSPASIAFGRKMLNSTPSQNLDLNKTGNEATTYLTTPSNTGLIVTGGDGSIPAGNPQTENLAVQLQNNLNGSGSTGVKAWTVTVDNTAGDSAAAGQGSADPNDVVNVSATILQQRSVTAPSRNLGNVIVGRFINGNVLFTTIGDDNNATRINLASNAPANADGISVGSNPNTPGQGTLFDSAISNSLRSFSGSFSTTGPKSSFVPIPVTSAEAASVGDTSPYPNAQAFYTATVYEPSNAEFVSPDATNTKTINFGSFPQGSGQISIAAALTNLVSASGLSAGLDFDSITLSSGAENVLFTSLYNNNNQSLVYANLSAGASIPFQTFFDTNKPSGIYSTTWILGLSDSDTFMGAAAANSQQLTLTLQGEIIGPPPLNDSRIYITNNPDFGRQMINSTPSINLTLSKIGIVATTYTATSNNAAISITSDGYIATGKQSEIITLNLQANAAGSGTTGAKSYTVTVDNTALDSAGTFQGSADPNEVFSGNATILQQRTVSQTGGATNLGSYIVGASVVGTGNLGTTGDDNNNTRVNVATTAGPNAQGIAITGGSGILFDAATDTGTRTFAGSFATAGSKAGSLALAVTSAETASVGDTAPYPSVLMAYTANAYDPSNAEFFSPTGLNMKTINFGVFPQGSGTYNIAAALTNIINTLNFTAGLDFDSISLFSGDGSVLSTDLVNGEFSNLTAGSNYGFLAFFDTSKPLGTYTTTWTLGLSDSNTIQGAAAANSQLLTLNLTGQITAPIPEPSSLTLASLGLLSLFGLRRLRSRQLRTSSPSSRLA